MIRIDMENHLLPGCVLKEELLTLPAEGGGFLLPELRDHPEERYLNMTLTVLENHAQAFELRVYGAEKPDDPAVIIRFGMMPALRAAVSLDLNWLDGHILFPGHRPGTQKIVCHGSRIGRLEIARAEFVSMPGKDPLHVRIELPELSNEPRPVIPFPDEPLADEFGQWTGKDWAGKLKSRQELTEALEREAARPDRWGCENTTPWGGDASRKIAEGTGFFSRKKKDGRWYLTDPSGCAFFSMGPDCAVVRCDARIDGLENALSPLPQRGTPEAADLYEPMKKAFGETERPGGLLFSYERWNLKKVFGERWYEVWQRMVVAQLKNMGMNTLGNWSDPALFGRMPYVTSLPEFPSTRHLIFRDFPDVLSDEYRESAEICAAALADKRDDPWMIGYFLRNEPAWAFVDHLLIADEVLRDPEKTACKEGLIAFLRERYGDDPRKLSEAWQKSFSSFDDLYQPQEKASRLSEKAGADIRAFSARLTEAYMRIPAEACRRADPNHMILGMRWAWISDPLLVSGWDAFDVFSINCYAVDPTPALDNVRNLGVDLPVMIGEFHFGALDAGLPATGLEAVTTQAEKAQAYRYYCERAAAHPQGAGCHWFQCYDQFALGRFDGENYQIGLFDITLRPYPAMEEAARAAAARVYDIHDGRIEPVERRPESLPMIAY